METQANLAKAIIAVMQEVKGIEKSQTVGTGAMSYKGVPDQEVKKIIGDSMAKNGLCILPISVQPKTQVDRWEETVTYNNVPQVKQKQQVFTEVTTQYLLLHTSGESQILSGYGQGTDSQDKSAGKASTYALKYTLLYTFLVPTGKIDDADSTHSEDIPVPAVKNAAKAQPVTVAAELPWITSATKDHHEGMVKHLAEGKSLDAIKKRYKMRPEDEAKLLAEVKTYKAEQAKLMVKA